MGLARAFYIAHAATSLHLLVRLRSENLPSSAEEPLSAQEHRDRVLVSASAKGCLLLARATLKYVRDREHPFSPQPIWPDSQGVYPMIVHHSSLTPTAEMARTGSSEPAKKGGVEAPLGFNGEGAVKGLADSGAKALQPLIRRGGRVAETPEVGEEVRLGLGQQLAQGEETAHAAPIDVAMNLVAGVVR